MKIYRLLHWPNQLGYDIKTNIGTIEILKPINDSEPYRAKLVTDNGYVIKKYGEGKTYLEAIANLKKIED